MHVINVTKDGFVVPVPISCRPTDQPHRSAHDVLQSFYSSRTSVVHIDHAKMIFTHSVVNTKT